MKNIFFAFILFVFYGHCYAVSWVKISSPSDQDRSMYVDAESINIQGNTVNAWVMTSYRFFQKEYGSNKEFKTTITLYKVVCSDKKTGTIKTVSYNDEMGAGDVVSFYENGDYPPLSHVIPGTVSEEIQQILCFKKNNPPKDSKSKRQ